MINKASTARSHDHADSDPKIEREEELTESDRELADGRRGIFVRISSDAKEILEAAKKLQEKGGSGQKTYAGVIEKLLEYFGRQSSLVQKNILEGVLSNPLKESEDLLARLHRAQHAFETKRFYFAIKSYNAIAKSLDNVDSSVELLDVCHFRLAHCWNQLSRSLRAEALAYDLSIDDFKDKSSHLYSLALEALDRALDYLGKLKDGGDDHELMRLIKHFNMACCFSLKAQYIVESKLDPTDPHYEDLGKDLRGARKDAGKTEKLWLNSIGVIWRDLDEDGGRAGVAAHDGFDWLGKISNTGNTPSRSKSSKDSKSKSEGIWVVNEAKEDPDFLFLRSAKEWKTKFDRWENDALEGASIATAIEDLLKESKNGEL